MRTHRFFAPTLAIVFALSIVPSVSAAAPPAESDAQRHDRVTRHWTAERIRAAVPRDFTFDPQAGTFQPRAKPGSGGGNVSGASWTKGGAVLQASGKVYFEMGGSGYVCSAATATDGRSSHALVLTAAHCAYDESSRAFATNWMFIPEFDSAPTFTCSQTKWGCWTARALVVHEGYASAGSFNQQATLHDFAFAVVAGGGHSGTAQLDATVGHFGVSIPGFSVDSTAYLFGYPASGKYRGKDLTYCKGPVSEDPNNGNLTWRVTCDMTGGSSGGPWFSNFSESTGSGWLSSVNSYGYSGVAAMHGPKFNTDTQDVYTAADSATANTIVP
jgi:hypothetical protein